MKRSLVFWMWNAPLDKVVIRRQIVEMHNKHIGGFFIHPMPSEFRADDFPGGMPGYLSEEYFLMVRYAAECAAEFKMDAWLYDEGGWPSGIVNGELMAEHPELGGRFINSKGELRYSDSRPDLLDPAVTQLFIERVHEKYREYMGEYFGRSIPGIFTDEPSFGALRVPDYLVFSPILEARFNAEKNYDARECAMRILRDNDPQARQDFNEIWVKLIVENYLTPIREWCLKNNLLFTGHFNGDDCVDNMEFLLGSDIFTLLEALDVPGCDAIWRQIHPLMPETDFSRITASAAGEKMSISETFAVYGSDLSLAEMKYTAAMQFIAGIKMVAPMALHYSNSGGRQVTTVSNFYGADPRWEYFDFYCDFANRISKVFDRTEPVIKAHVPFPRTALQRGECKDRDVFSRGLKLAAQQITYDYQPDAAELPEDIECDVKLAFPVSALRTRHLRSPRGERRIFVNSGLENISVKFTAPDGFNAWYDPSNGKHVPAQPDENGLLALELPFGGCMVLLTIPGRSFHLAAQQTENRRSKPVGFSFKTVLRQIKGSPEGLVDIVPDGSVDENFCGTRRYEAEFEADAAQTVRLVLPEAKRAMCRLILNGQDAGVKVWPPYFWEIDVVPGKNLLELDVSGTPEAAFTAPEHLRYLQENRFNNVYFERCMGFEKLFPGEQPLADARVEF